MKNKIIIVDPTLFSAFKKDCKVLSLAKEYPGYSGYDKYLILTDLTKEELIQKYNMVLKNYEPYLIDSMRLYTPISDYNKNEDKFSKRNIRNTVSIDDEYSNKKLTNLSIENIVESAVTETNSEVEKLVLKALKTLTETEKHRLLLWGLHKLTEEEIAYKEGSSQQAVSKSLKQARKKFENFFSGGLYFDTPLSKEDEGTC